MAPPTPWPCSQCDQPGVKNLGTRGYCAQHLAALTDRIVGDRGHFTPAPADAALEDEWPDPIPLGAATGDPPPFPVGCLPSWMQAHVLSVADEQQVAVDLPAMLGVAALSLALTKRYRIHIQADWHEPLNLYLVVALPPSAGKSPVFKRMFRIYEQHEASLVASATGEADLTAQRRRMIEARMHKAEKSEDAVAAQIALEELRATPAVIVPQLMADDITVEVLVELLAQQGGRLGLLSDEGGLFDGMAGRYSDKSTLDPYLQAWSGSTIRVNRIGRGTSIVYDPLLTVGLTVQPAVIRGIAAKPEFRGRGLTARFMYAMPKDFVGRRDFKTARINDRDAAERYESKIQTMLNQPMPDEPVTLELAPEAWQMFAEWRQMLEERRTTDGDLRPMADWTTKLESSVCRLAALLHVADGTGGAVSLETMARALEVGAYWLEHAKAVHDLWGTSDVAAAAVVIVDWLAAHRRSEFTVRDVYNERRTTFPDAASTVDPLNLLIDKGWIRPLFDGPLLVGRRGVESPKLQAHPRFAVDNSNNCNNHAAHAADAYKNHFEDFLSPSPGMREREGSPPHEPHEPHDTPSNGASDAPSYEDVGLDFP